MSSAILSRNCSDERSVEAILFHYEIHTDEHWLPGLVTMTTTEIRELLYFALVSVRELIHIKNSIYELDT